MNEKAIMSSPFLLAPWEVVRGGHLERRLGEIEAELEAPDASPFRGKLLISRMKSHFAPGGNLWFRPQNTPDEGNFFVASLHPVNARHFKPMEHYLEEDGYSKYLNKAFAQGAWGRIYFLNAVGELVEENKFASWRLCVLANGLAAWQQMPSDGSLALKSEATALFHWGTTAHAELLTTTSALKFWEKAGNTMWPDARGRFALDWIGRSWEETQQAVLAFNHGSRQEMEHIIQLLITSDAELWQHHSIVSWILVLNRSKRHGIKKATPDLKGQCFILQGANGRKISTLRIDLWAGLLFRHFYPHRAPITKGHLCVDEWLGRAVICTESPTLKSPTAHEMLEARVELKEWAKEQLSPKLLALVDPLEG